MLPVWLKAAGDSCILSVHTQPGAAKSALAGEHGEALKIRIQARPVEGAANLALLAFLGKQFGIPKSSLELISGETSRAKRIKVPLSADAVLQKLILPRNLHSSDGT